MTGMSILLQQKQSTLQQSSSAALTPSSCAPTEQKRSVVTPNNRTIWLDASEIYRPEGFRDFNLDNGNPLMQRVFESYVNMHTYQTVDFVREKKAKWTRFDHEELPIMEALVKLNSMIDECDPDVDVPNIVHAFQTAERARESHPDEDWFHLTALIHDLGKVLAVWGEPHWCVAGDTFVVGCEPGESVVFRDSTFHDNSDMKDPRYNTKCGMYEPNCGLANLEISWGHDEYLYLVLKNHPEITCFLIGHYMYTECSIPEEGLFMIRYHSLYPWHAGHDYWHLCTEKDKEYYYWIKEFNKYDLYSKSDSMPDIEDLKPYYQSLIDKYCPGLIKF